MEIFVFASNSDGTHSSGYAFRAVMRHGAIRGVPTGPQGRSYAIVTKVGAANVDLRLLKQYVDKFITFARNHPNDVFKVTPIGVGVNSYSHDDIAPMFATVPDNCIMPAKWKPYLYYNEELKYWNC